VIFDDQFSSISVAVGLGKVFVHAYFAAFWASINYFYHEF